MAAQHEITTYSDSGKNTRPRICDSVCSHDCVLVYTAEGWSLIPDPALLGYPDLDAAVEQADADEYAGDDLFDALIISAAQNLDEHEEAA